MADRHEIHEALPFIHGLSGVAGAAVQHVREATLQPRLALRFVAPSVNDLAEHVSIQ